jgi:cytoskeletal protein CcmA (bactofilin family)
MFSKDKEDGKARKRESSMPSIISPGMRVTGNLSSEGELQIEGVIDGDIKCHTVTVGADSAVTGLIECEDARVLGTVKGEIRARSVFIAASARVSGDIVHETISVEPGAYIEGQLKRLDVADSKIAVVGEAKKPSKV